MDKNIIMDLQKKAFEYFMDYTNFDHHSKGYGLTCDHSKNEEVASIAATGFMLSGLVIGVNHGWIEKEEAMTKVLGTLKTLYHHVPHAFGFFAHFVDIKTAERVKKSEYSTIDTALLLCGILTCDTYFQNAEISSYALLIIQRIKWEEFIFEKNDKLYLRMAYNPDKDGAYVKDKPGFIHQWDMFAEQLMMYVMIAGSAIDEKISYKLYKGFDRNYQKFNDLSFIASPHNTLFVYHFPLAWLDLKDIIDDDQISWYDNAKTATIIHQLNAIDHQKTFKGFSRTFFGCNASDTPKGYRVFGALPNDGNKLDTDGTIAPFSMIGALPFIPEVIHQSIEDMLKIEQLQGPYGFYDAFNLNENEPWFSKRYISIDKGLELLMIDAYMNQTVYQSFMNHPIIHKGMEVLKWKKKNGGNVQSSIKSIH